MQLDWSALANVPDAGAAFRAGMEKAQAARQEAQKRAALTAYGMGDPNALNALMQADPMLGMQLKQQQQTQQAGQADQRVKLFGRAAQAAKTPEQGDAIARHLMQIGYPEAEAVIGKWTPELRLAYMAAAGITDASDNPTEMQRNYEYLSSKDQKLGDAYLNTRANPPMFVSNGQGGGDFIDRSSLGGQPAASPPAVLTDDDWDDEGGPAPAGPGGFL